MSRSDTPMQPHCHQGHPQAGAISASENDHSPAPGPVDLFVRVSMPAPALIMILAPSPCCGFSVARRFNADFRILHPEQFRLAGISVRLPAFPVHIAPATSTLWPIAAVDGACADSLGHVGLLSSGPAVSWAVTAVPGPFTSGQYRSAMTNTCADSAAPALCAPIRSRSLPRFQDAAP
jgi:hypothetical protein